MAMQFVRCQRIGDALLNGHGRLVLIGFPPGASAGLDVVENQQLVDDGQRRSPDGRLYRYAVFANARGDRQLKSGPR